MKVILAIALTAVSLSVTAFAVDKHPIEPVQVTTVASTAHG